MRKDIKESMILMKNDGIKPNYAELAKNTAVIIGQLKSILKPKNQRQFQDNQNHQY